MTERRAGRSGRTPWRRALALVAAAALVAMSAPAHAAPPDRPGSVVTFHGWSKDSKYVTYTRHSARLDPDKPGAPPIRAVSRVHRRVSDGAYEGYGAAVGTDVAAHARAHDYVTTRLSGTTSDGAGGALPSAGTRTFHFLDAGAVDSGFRLDVRVAERLVWTLRVADVVVASRPFDALYLAVEAELHPSPDGRQAILVMHLDAGWATHAAVYPLMLPRAAIAAARQPASPDAD